MSTTDAAAPPRGALEWVRTHWDFAPSTCDRMPGGAGARRYWRVSDTEGHTAVFMWALSEDPAILPPGLRATQAGIPFLEVGAFLGQAGIPVPRVHATDVERRWILLEDLGSRHLGDLTGTALSQAHEAAIDLLARVHALSDPSRGAEPPLPFRRRFDRDWIRFELDLFLGLDWAPRTRAELRAALDPLVDRIAVLPPVLCLRDYQSQNLMLDPDGLLRVIDFQDAFLAPAALDLAALLWDSYLAIAPNERLRLLERYSQRAPRPVTPEELSLLIVQRKCKDLSRFQLLVGRGDDRYGRARERAAQAIREAAAALPDDLEELRVALPRALDALKA